jgi:asparagine synthase (glutamine-hydrolysing)
MSGIVGIIHFDGQPVKPGQIEQMTAAMAYRGPDGIQHWHNGSIALGHCMLRTTPEALQETQPWPNEANSLMLVMDGRVDNWQTLRQQLLAQGVTLRNRSDAELVLRSYELWGKHCVNHIEGDFALAIWDAKQQTVFCARDPLGNKTLHYHWDGNTLAFASELHPILALPWVKEVVNEGMLAEFLAGEWYSRDETLWQGILRLVAAHTMHVSAAGIKQEHYWQPDVWATLPYTTEQQYVEHYRELVFDSIKRQSRCHKPVAIEVSGGLDSSAIFCVAEHLRQNNQLPAPGIAGYTFAFTDTADNKAAYELDYARAIGQHWGVTIHEIAPSMPSLAWYEEQAKRYRDFVGFPNGSMSLDLREAAAQHGSCVVFTGEGGDQWADGSRLYYAEELVQRHWRALYGCFQADADAFGMKQALKWLLRYGCFPVLPIGLQNAARQFVNTIRKPAMPSANTHFWLSSIQADILAQRIVANNFKVRCHDQQELLTMLYRPLYAQVMERDERDTARSGIELRHPLHTPQIVQLAFATSVRFRLQGDIGKVIHRKALQTIMPTKVLNRKDKAEFSVAFRIHLNNLQTLFSRDIPKQRPTWLHQESITQLYHIYQNNPQSGWPLWILWSIYLCNVVLPK